jgi:RNA polymerase sigma-70 factor (ECF subfamily)
LKPDVPAGRSNPEDRAVPDDALLVARARARDTEAFRMLVERHQDRAYSLALRMLRSAEDAQEVAQDAFVRAWNALPGFRGEARFGTWLHRIVARRALDRAALLRHRGRREIVADAEQIPAEQPAVAGIEAVRLERLIAGLDDAPRTVVTLFYYEDRSVEEVAGILGMPAGTVKTHLSRARAALRTAWLREDAGRERPALGVTQEERG